MAPESFFDQIRLEGEQLLWSNHYGGPSLSGRIWAVFWKAAIGGICLFQFALTGVTAFNVAGAKGMATLEFIGMSSLAVFILYLSYIALRSALESLRSKIVIQLITDYRIVVSSANTDEIRILSGRPFRDLNVTRSDGAYDIYAEPMMADSEDGLILRGIKHPTTPRNLLSQHFMVRKDEE